MLSEKYKNPIIKQLTKVVNELDKEKQGKRMKYLEQMKMNIDKLNNELDYINSVSKLKIKTIINDYNPSDYEKKLLEKDPNYKNTKARYKKLLNRKESKDYSDSNSSHDNSMLIPKSDLTINPISKRQSDPIYQRNLEKLEKLKKYRKSIELTTIQEKQLDKNTIDYNKEKVISILNDEVIKPNINEDELNFFDYTKLQNEKYTGVKKLNDINAKYKKINHNLKEVRTKYLNNSVINLKEYQEKLIRIGTTNIDNGTLSEIKNEMNQIIELNLHGKKKQKHRNNRWYLLAERLRPVLHSSFINKIKNL